jgi:HemX protein
MAPENIVNDIFIYSLPILYLATVWAYGKAFFTGTGLAKRLKTPLLIVTVILHAAFIAGKTADSGHLPATNIFEAFSALALSVTLTYLFIELRTQQKETGFFIINIAFFFQLVSSLFIKNIKASPEILYGSLFGIHVSSALVGYAGITIAGAYGLMYLMLYHEMKAKRFGAVYRRLPTLETLERMCFTAVRLSFLLLTVTIVFGIIWLGRMFQNPLYTDAKLISTVIVWAWYGFLIAVKTRRGWNGRSIMILSIAGFLFSIFSLTVINLFFSGFHRFY